MIVLNLFGYSKSPKEILIHAGYSESFFNLIRQDNDGRFHAKSLGRTTYDLHYDLFVGNKHFSPPMPIKEAEEVKRILSLAEPFKHSYRIPRGRRRVMGVERKSPSWG